MIHVAPNSVVPLDDPLVLWEPAFALGVVSADSIDGENYASNAANPSTHDVWKPAALPATWISSTVSTGVQHLMNCVAFAAHDLGSKRCSVRIKYFYGLARTNRHLWSEDFSTGWSISNPSHSTLIANAGEGPDGSNKAGLFSATSTLFATRRLFASANIAVSPNEQHMASIYLKSNGHRYIGVNLAAGNALVETAAISRVDLNTGTITTEKGTGIISQLQNGWFKITLFGTTGPSTGYRLSVAIIDSMSTGSTAATPIVGAGVLVFGAHVEEQSIDQLDRGYLATGSGTTTANFQYYSDFYIPTSDSPFMILHQATSRSAKYLEVAGSTPPSIGVINGGTVQSIPVGISPNYVPLHLSRETILETSRSLNGQFFGNRVSRRGMSGSVIFTPIHRDLVEANLESFVQHYDDGGSFFFSPSPDIFPLDLVYCWRSESAGSMRPSFDEAGEFMSLSLNIEGY